MCEAVKAFVMKISVKAFHTICVHMCCADDAGMQVVVVKDGPQTFAGPLSVKVQPSWVIRDLVADVGRRLSNRGSNLIVEAIKDRTGFCDEDDEVSVFFFFAGVH